ncbi:MAG: 1-acyl-sn-glycerol-3-phosphate acyltransferase [Paludibacter sp.]|nr:1-acyl-sn-glycerol-3-phosphate acyltransferase [Paludibacter sp.]
MSKIYDFTTSYSLSKYYVNFLFKQFYSKFIVIGRENIPTDTPIIFAPNHNNALMDALAILATIPHKLPVVFLARADMFNNKLAAKGLHFTKIMPAFRMRDGLENLGKNQAIFDRCVEVLEHNKALGIMPEGNQSDQKKIRPLVKGIFRIAFAAQQKHGTRPNVKIIPVGLDYGDYVKFGKHLILSFGEPIEVSDYMEHYEENTVLATNEIRTALKTQLCNLTVNFDTTEFYDCYETVVEIANTSILEEEKITEDVYSLFKGRQKLGNKLNNIELENKDKIEKLNVLSREYKEGLSRLKLKTKILEKAPFKALNLFLESILLLISLPVFILGLLLNFLPFFAPVFLRKYVFKAQYDGFFSSLQFGLGIFTFPLFYILQLILFWNLISSIWWMCLLFFISQYLFGKVAMRWYRETRTLFAKLRFIRLKNSKLMKRTQEIRLEIIQLIKD